ncbi:MAG: type II secretion system F family protein [Acidobacteriota bacterium]
MATQFVCRLGTPDGQIVTEVHQGSDATTLRRELERRGMEIFEIKPKGLSLLRRAGARQRPRISTEAFLAFNQELAALLRAGLPLLQGLEMIGERVEDVAFRQVLNEIRDRVKSGEELSEAFASFGDLFPPLYASTLKAGERSGELEQVLRRFMRYQRLMLGVRKRVTSALVYPSVLIGLAITMLGVLSIYVVPRFSVFYADLGAELPALTRTILNITQGLRSNLLLILAVLIGGGWLVRRWARTEAGGLQIDRMRLQLPLLGSVFHQFALSELCRSLATLLAGGIPLLQALDTAIEAVGNRHMRGALQPAVRDVREGRSFHEALDATDVMPHMAIDMIKVGEATGSLDEMLTSVSDYFDEQTETRIQRMLSLIEPAMLVIMGILIAVLLIAIYLPMFSVLGQVGE